MNERKINCMHVVIFKFKVTHISCQRSFEVMEPGFKTQSRHKTAIFTMENSAAVRYKEINRQEHVGLS